MSKGMSLFQGQGLNVKVLRSGSKRLVRLLARAQTDSVLRCLQRERCPAAEGAVAPSLSSQGQGQGSGMGICSSLSALDVVFDRGLWVQLLCV